MPTIKSKNTFQLTKPDSGLKLKEEDSEIRNHISSSELPAELLSIEETIKTVIALD